MTIPPPKYKKGDPVVHKYFGWDGCILEIPNEGSAAFAPMYTVSWNENGTLDAFELILYTPAEYEFMKNLKGV